VCVWLLTYLQSTDCSTYIVTMPQSGR